MKRLILLLCIVPISLLATSFSTEVSFDPAKPEGFSTAPGRLRLPVYSVNILLPAGAEITGWEVELGSAVPQSQTYRDFNPAWYDGEKILNASRHDSAPSPYSFLGLRKWGDLRYAAFSFAPADPISGQWYPTARITLDYSRER
ncbi:MAG TPA: hypothetical protein PKI59_07270, partial [Candidatus Cloacimonadota bacterium]|nr:hypothetical protein [Candidatus Cloacimonadota bacterium]